MKTLINKNSMFSTRPSFLQEGHVAEYCIDGKNMGFNKNIS